MEWGFQHIHPRLCGEPEPTDAEVQEMIRLMDPAPGQNLEKHTRTGDHLDTSQEKNGNLGTYWEPHGKQYGQNLGCGDLTKQQNEDWENMFSAPKPAPNQGRQRFDRLRRVPALLCGAPTVPGTMM